ncbi:MAG TPA: KUP/HAK/KT family potassium transporter, partial [Candidatus Limnocylindrales bacterium]|nr:KUP/HAK/KT family potassium transporter [Candidatus Limnocylindrales bacterium]
MTVSPPAATNGVAREHHERPIVPLALAALGVVFGDIGTSPLYALRECFSGPHGIEPSPANIRGVLSLVLWSLVLVISVKYVLYIMRADNRGEGGILALMALVRPAGRRGPQRWAIVTLGLFGAALLYGDGAITPAISVLSAVEGLSVVTPALDSYIVPIAIVILVAFFLLQKRGTAKIGALFGPVMLVWFGVLAVLGAAAILRVPEVLIAAFPEHAVSFFARNGGHGFLVLGTVVLAVTGGEALYADMGHFGPRPIRLVWFGLVLPALLLNYFGQGALLLADPAAAEHAFFRLAPEWALLPLVLLATAATVIACQAIVSGAFSLTRQAVQLGFAPRMAIEHTSAEEIGQIYVPSVNWVLMLATI